MPAVLSVEPQESLPSVETLTQEPGLDFRLVEVTQNEAGQPCGGRGWPPESDASRIGVSKHLGWRNTDRTLDFLYSLS